MKIQKMITIDSELVDKLGDINVSATVNKFLRDYLEVNTDLTIEEMRDKTRLLAEKKMILLTKMRHFKAEIAKKQAKLDEIRKTKGPNFVLEKVGKGFYR